MPNNQVCLIRNLAEGSITLWYAWWWFCLCYTFVLCSDLDAMDYFLKEVCLYLVFISGQLANAKNTHKSSYWRHYQVSQHVPFYLPMYHLNYQRHLVRPIHDINLYLTVIYEYPPILPLFPFRRASYDVGTPKWVKNMNWKSIWNISNPGTCVNWKGYQILSLVFYHWIREM